MNFIGRPAAPTFITTRLDGVRDSHDEAIDHKHVLEVGNTPGSITIFMLMTVSSKVLFFGILRSWYPACMPLCVFKRPAYPSTSISSPTSQFLILSESFNHRLYSSLHSDTFTMFSTSIIKYFGALLAAQSMAASISVPRDGAAYSAKLTRRECYDNETPALHCYTDAEDIPQDVELEDVKFVASYLRSYGRQLRDGRRTSTPSATHPLLLYWSLRSHTNVDIFPGLSFHHEGR